MEGILWKWTNYWNGWQTRWFVLDNGILSYYKSQDEVSQGCKGSVKVSVCQINVNALDNTRLDLVIPGQQHMYLKAPSPQDRQKWLVALGSAKACVDSNSDFKVLDDASSLNHKKSELMLYCDLMMQQVHEVKSAVKAEGGPEIEVKNKLKNLISAETQIVQRGNTTIKIDDTTSLLTATCDTFIRTLEDIMRLTNQPTPNIVGFDKPLVTEAKTVYSAIKQSASNSTKLPRQTLSRTQSQENR